jgi:hypothetical protein
MYNAALAQAARYGKQVGFLQKSGRSKDASEIHNSWILFRSQFIEHGDWQDVHGLTQAYIFALRRVV